jgi:hypothetical protein
MKKEKVSIKRLEHIETASFNMGNYAYEGFKESSSLASLKGAVTSYRCCMQAIRDQARYKVSTKKS